MYHAGVSVAVNKTFPLVEFSGHFYVQLMFSEVSCYM